MKSVLLFGAAALLIFLCAAAVSVYCLGQYEHAWGRGGSFQVEAWLGLVGALVAMGSFGISSAALRRTHDQRVSFVLGAVCAVVCICLCWIASSFTSFSGPYLAFALLVVLSALAALAGRRDAD
jgi:hypothetical protein